MPEPRPLLPERVPTLTEVVEWQETLQPEPVPSGDAPASAPSLAGAPVLPLVEPTELTAEVLFELESRIDALFEARLREALAPALARMADGLIREARDELSQRLREMVHEAVTRALERHTGL
jgi:hypothetical protein